MERIRTRYDILLLQGTLVLAIVARLWLMATQPLTDLTEARYGELARVTADGNFWLMPHITPTEPFLAKPPLATWMAALSWKLLGESEFALRLPSFLVSLAAGGLLLSVAGDFGATRVGRWMLAAMLATSPIWIVTAGTVMTDATQMAIVTAAMVTSWRALQNTGVPKWRRLFWVTVGLATISKGVATLALIGLPLTAYLLFGEGWRVMWRALWDPLGAALAAAIALAWYVPAEMANPGFLKYFLIGEHLQRFLEPNWTGDRFGHAHNVPWGMIWVYWVAATGFWLPVMIQELGNVLRSPAPAWARRPDRWLWCWILAPLVFFTFARNILWTYTLTAIPPFALMVGRWADSSFHPGRRATPALLMTCTIIVFGLVIGWAPARLESRSARDLVNRASICRPGHPLAVNGCYSFSGSFYSRGLAQRADSAADLEAVLHRPGTVLIAPPGTAQYAIDRGLAVPLENAPDHDNPRAILVEVIESRFASR